LGVVFINDDFCFVVVGMISEDDPFTVRFTLDLVLLWDRDDELEVIVVKLFLPPIPSEADNDDELKNSSKLFANCVLLLSVIKGNTMDKSKGLLQNIQVIRDDPPEFIVVRICSAKQPI